METTVLLVHHLAQQHDFVPMYLEQLTEHGFLVVQQHYLQGFTDEQLHAITHPNYQHTSAEDVQPETYTSSPVLALQVQRLDAIAQLTSLVADWTFKYCYTSSTAYQAVRDSTWYFPSKQQQLDLSVVVLKPQYTPEQSSRLLALLAADHYVLLSQYVTVLSPNQAEQVATTKADGAQRAAELQYLQSDTSVVYLLEKVNAVADLLLASGPVSVSEAKRDAPHSLRAVLADATQGQTNSYENLLYVSPTVPLSSADKSLFFPQPLERERSVLIVKPAAVNTLATVIELLKQYQFVVVTQSTTHLSQHRVNHWLQRRGVQSGRAEAVKELIGNAAVILLLERVACIATLSALQQLQQLKQADVVYSSSTGEATLDVSEFFSHLQTYKPTTAETLNTFLHQRPAAAIKPLVDGVKLSDDSLAHKSINELLIDGLTALCRAQPLAAAAPLDASDAAILWLATWLEEHNPYKPVVSVAQKTADSVGKENVPVHRLTAAKPQPSANVIKNFDDEEQDVPSDRHISWLVAAPYTAATAITAAIPANHATIDVPRLIQAAAADGGNQYAAIINAHLSTQRTVPTHIVIALISEALTAASASQLVLVNFPATYDEAFALEKLYGKPAQLIYVGQAVRQSYADWKGQSVSTEDENKLKQVYGQYTEDVVPVLEHYHQFNKLKLVR